MFRLSKSEALVLRSKFALSNMKPAEFVRDCVLTNRTTVIARPQATLEMNSANVAGKLTDAHYQEALASLANIAKYLKSALNHVD